MLLKKGSKGEDVKRLQLALGIKADGDFGPYTEKKVIEFQNQSDLTPDGIVGRNTWEKLGIDTDQQGYSTTLNFDGDVITKINNYKILKSRFL